jgi:hypothetical protein
VRIALRDLRAAADKRGPGYFEEVCALGQVEGEHLIIADARRADYEKMFRRVRGLGDAVEVFAKPIARALDAAFGTDLENCAGCAERREKLNESVPFS